MHQRVWCTRTIQIEIADACDLQPNCVYRFFNFPRALPIRQASVQDRAMTTPNIPAAWHNTSGIRPRRFVCGYCGSDVQPTLGYFTNGPVAQIYICPCNAPTLFDAYGVQFPRPRIGKEIPNLPADVARVYSEIRDTMSAGAFLGASLLSRTLLLYVAVEEAPQGAPKPSNFVEAIDSLVGSGHVTPKTRPWVDKLRQLGNRSAHDIAEVSEAEASDLMHFVEMLLTIVYDFPTR